MAQAWWETDDEVCSPIHAAPGPELLLQKGTYNFYDGSPAEQGYRVVWRKSGRLQARPARFDDLDELQDLIELGRGRGWT